MQAVDLQSLNWHVVHIFYAIIIMVYAPSFISQHIDFYVQVDNWSSDVQLCLHLINR